jgi:hypothetical protein
VVAVGQIIKGKTYKKMLSADSVVVVSHFTTYVPIVDDVTLEKKDQYELVTNGMPNYQIIKESKRLRNDEEETLAGILSTKNNDRTIEDISCFMPHHGILIFKSGQCSFFDICFGCNHFVTSKDITLSDELSRKSWKVLQSFFRKKNFKYGWGIDD